MGKLRNNSVVIIGWLAIVFAIVIGFIYGSTQGLWLVMLFVGLYSFIIGIRLFLSESFRKRWYSKSQQAPSSLGSKLDKLYHRYIWPEHWVVAEFAEQKNGINALIGQKNILLNDNRVEELNMEEALDHCFRFINEAVRTWIEADYPTRIRFQKMVFKQKLPFDGKKFGNTDLALVYKLSEEYDGDKSHLVDHRRRCIEL